MAPTHLTMSAPGRAPSPEEARSLAQALSQGELVLLPTETVYGIAARADSQAALDRLTAIKERPKEMAFTLHLGAKLNDFASQLPSDLALPGIARRLATDFWPGPLTLVVATAAPELQLLSKNGLVGMRAPCHAFTSELLAQLDFGVVLSSANLHGIPAPTDAIAALKTLGTRASQLAYIVDAGPTASAQANRSSSVLLLESGRFELTREGLLSLDDLRRSAGLHIAFACTGNTCRSPMAQALAKRTVNLLLKQDPAHFGFQFNSMGLAAYPGSPPSEHALKVMQTKGIDISGHRSQPADADSILDLDHIYTMTRAHRNRLLTALSDRRPGQQARVPKVETLDPDNRNISDPFGGSLDDYEHAASDIQAGIAARLSDWL